MSAITDISDQPDQIVLSHDHCGNPICIDCAANHIIATVEALRAKQDCEHFAVFLLDIYNNIIAAGEPILANNNTTSH